MTYTIVRGAAAHAAALPRVERAAGALFRTIGMDDVAAHDPTPVELHEHRAAMGQLYVALSPQAEPVGFLIWSPKDGYAYIEEVSVSPDHAGQRLGARLIDRLAEDMRARFPALTLATFRNVPWNAPYYARLGFSEWPFAEAGPGHRESWQDQAEDGLDMTKRLFMIRRL